MEEDKDIEFRSDLLKGLLSIWYPDKCNYEEDKESIDE